MDDAVNRLLPGVSADVSDPLGTTLRELHARRHAPTPDASAIREALARTHRTLDEFRAPARTDAATLDALRLELAVDQ